MVDAEVGEKSFRLQSALAEWMCRATEMGRDAVRGGHGQRVDERLRVGGGEAEE